MVVTEDTVMRRLRALEPTQESVETIALWVLHHHQEHSTVAHCWLDAFREADGDKQRLALVYLLNDVCQKARRKKLDHLRNAFVQPFTDAAKVIRNNEKLVSQVDRVLNILVEREIFSPGTIAKIRTGFRSKSGTKRKPVENNESHNNSAAVDSIADDDNAFDYDDAVIADFSPDTLITELERHKQSETMITKARELLTTDAFSIKVKNSVKDREQGKKVLRDIDRAIKRMSDFIEALEAHVKQHQSMVASVQKGVTYFGAQLRDATVVEEAYRSFGAGISHVKDSLADIDRTGVFPAASPPRDAPSPGKDDDPFESGVENVIEEMKKPGALDSFQEADMELDDDYLNSVEANDSFMSNPAMVRRAAAATSSSSSIKVDPRLSRLGQRMPNANGAPPPGTAMGGDNMPQHMTAGPSYANTAPPPHHMPMASPVGAMGDNRFSMPPPPLFDPNRPPPAFPPSQISPQASAVSPVNMLSPVVSGPPPRVYGHPPPPVSSAATSMAESPLHRPAPTSSVSPPPPQQARLGYMQTSSVYHNPQGQLRGTPKSTYNQGQPQQQQQQYSGGWH